MQGQKVTDQGRNEKAKKGPGEKLKSKSCGMEHGYEGEGPGAGMALGKLRKLSE